MCRYGTELIGIRSVPAFVSAALAPDEGAVGDESLHAVATIRNTASTVAVKIFIFRTPPQLADKPASAYLKGVTA